MQIKVPALGSDGLPVKVGDEYVLFNMQGRIETDNANDQFTELGELELDSDSLAASKKATLSIGTHKLRGQVKLLPKPLLLLKKPEPKEQNDAMGDSGLYFEGLAIIRRVIQFTDRPDIVLASELKGRSTL